MVEEKRRLIEAGKAEGEIIEPDEQHSWTRIRLTTPTSQLGEFLDSPAADSFFEEKEHSVRRMDVPEWPVTGEHN